MIELLRPAYDLNWMYVQKLVADVPDEQMCAQPAPPQVMNHPAFLLGHLAWAKLHLLRLLGQPQDRADEMKELFGMGSKPLPDRSSYPAKSELLKTLEETHVLLLTAVSSATPELMAQPSPERMRARFPLLGQMFFGVMTSHYALHVGQISAWRRAMGFPSVF